MERENKIIALSFTSLFAKLFSSFLQARQKKGKKETKKGEKKVRMRVKVSGWVDGREVEVEWKRIKKVGDNKEMEWGWTERMDGKRKTDDIGWWTESGRY